MDKLVDTPSPSDSKPARAMKEQALMDIALKIAGNAFRKQGFSQAAILSHWRDIVGPAFAQHCLPLKLTFPAGKRRGGTLTILVEGPFALQIAHVQPQVIERINRFFGYAAVERLSLKQGALPQEDAPGPVQEPDLSNEQQIALDNAVKGVKDIALAATLKRLGRLVLSR